MLYESTGSATAEKSLLKCYQLLYATSKPSIERVQALTDISRSHYAAMAMQRMRRLQIRPMVHNYGVSSTILPSYIRIRAVLYGMRPRTNTQTDRDTQTRETTKNFAS